MAIYQNSCLWYPIWVTANGKPLPLESVETIEFHIGGLTKHYPSKNGDVIREKDYFEVRLSQEETRDIPKKIAVQARVKYTDGIVMPTPIAYVDREDVLSRKVL